LFWVSAPTPLRAQWLESKGAHYTVFYQAGFEDDAAFTRKWLDATEEFDEDEVRIDT
jgi:hypothetical protein